MSFLLKFVIEDLPTGCHAAAVQTASAATAAMDAGASVRGSGVEARERMLRISEWPAERKRG